MSLSSLVSFFTVTLMVVVSLDGKGAGAELACLEVRLSVVFLACMVDQAGFVGACERAPRDLTVES